MSAELTPPTIAGLELAITTEMDALDPAGDLDPIIAVHHKAQLFKQVATALVKATEAKMVEALKAHGQAATDLAPARPAEINVGPLRYYVGETKTTKPRNHTAIMEAVLELTDGDEGRVADCLSANAWKYGTVRTLIETVITDQSKAAAKFNELFEVKVKEDLETGKPKIGLNTINENFLR